MRSVLLSALVLAGCSNYGLEKPPAPPVQARAPAPPGLARICVLRPHNLAMAVTFVVHDNERLVGATRGPTYFCYYAEPGPHYITTDSGDEVTEARLTAEPDRRYYLHQQVDNIFGYVRGRLEWVDESTGLDMLDRCGYRVLVAVPGDETLPPTAPLVPASPPKGT